MRKVDGKVSVVFDDHRIAINVGATAGVNIGDAVELYEVIDIADPDTSEPLGAVTLVKARLKVAQVQEKLCIAEVPISGGGVKWTNTAFANIFGEAPKRGVRLVSRNSLQDDPSVVSVAIGDQVSVIVDDTEQAEGSRPDRG